MLILRPFSLFGYAITTVQRMAPQRSAIASAASRPNGIWQELAPTRDKLGRVGPTNGGANVTARDDIVRPHARLVLCVSDPFGTIMLYVSILVELLRARPAL